SSPSALLLPRLSLRCSLGSPRSSAWERTVCLKSSNSIVTKGPRRDNSQGSERGTGTSEDLGVSPVSLPEVARLSRPSGEYRQAVPAWRGRGLTPTHVPIGSPATARSMFPSFLKL